MRRTLAALALALVCATALSAREVGETLPPDFLLGVDLEGTPVTLASLGGKPVVVRFWATWCGACMKAMRLAEALHRKFDGRFAVVAITGDSKREISRFLRKIEGEVTLRITREERRKLANSSRCVRFPPRS